MEYRYPTEQEKCPNLAVQEYHDKAIDKGLLQNMHEDRLPWKQFKAKLRKEHRAALRASIRQDKAWWQRGDYGWVATWNYAHVYCKGDKETYPLAQYWYRALGIPLP